MHLSDFNAAQHSISLSPDEKKLFDMFRQVVAEERLGTTVRIAGGWVRDKLLGVRGKEDIDVALDNMTGKQFAGVMNTWLKRQGHRNINIGIIQQNPEKSKHLETATATLGKFSVDFVNLRTETYSVDSRIPEVKIGTPLEDALRRDLTINSLFYNVNSDSVEDFTGRGIDDLKLRVVRTPLPALTTLQDDPLRALRAVRFACRFGFRISDDLQEACADPTVRDLLKTKVSRERVNQEMELMVCNEFCVRAATVLHDLELLPLVFVLPAAGDVSVGSALSASRPEDLRSLPFHYESEFHAYGLAVLLTGAALRSALPPSAGALRSLLLQLDSSPEQSKLCHYAALSVGGRSLFTTHPKKSKVKKVPLNDVMLLSSLKMRTKDVAYVLAIQEASLVFMRLIEEGARYTAGSVAAVGLSAGAPERGGPCFGPYNRLALGRAVLAVGDQLQCSVYLACCSLVLSALHKSSDAASRRALLRTLVEAGPAPGLATSLLADEEVLAVLRGTDLLLEAVGQLQLDGLWSAAPALGGDDIKQLLPNIPPGPSFGRIVQAAREYSLCRPQDGVDNVRAFLLGEFEEFR